MFYAYQIIIWLIFLLFISSKIKKKNRRILFSIIVSFFTTLEIAAVYMTEKFIDYRFYNHMNLNAIEGHGFQFVSQFISFVCLFIFLNVAFYFISKKMNTSTLRHNKFFIPVVLTSFILLSLPNGVFNETYKIYEILDAEEKDFNQALTDVGISPEKYITPDQLTAQKGKNIIVISLESLEQGFLGKDFNNITPNLSKLSTEWTFYNQMPVSPGGDWTAGSLYNHQVGMPAFFKGQLDEYLYGATSAKLTGLGHILNKAGYISKYIVGKAEFAGMADILNAYGISTVSENNALGKYPEVAIGFHDYDLFQEAKLQIKEFQKDENQSFALFLSTVNSHFPNGIYDERMEQFISKKENDLEFSVSAADYLVADFITYLKENKLFKNTAIYIFPDHTLMGSSSTVHDKLAKSTRQLYLLTNVNENKLFKKTSDTLYQIDLPRIIVDGAEIKTNAKFLVDFIQTDNVINFLNTNRVQLTTLNSASIIRKNYLSGINISVEDNNLTIQTEGNTVNFALSSGTEIFDLTFNSNMALIEKGKKNNIRAIFKLHKYVKELNRLHMSIFLNDRKIEKVCLGNLQTVGICKHHTQLNYTKDEIKTIINGEAISLSYLYYSYIAPHVERLKNSINKRL